MSTWSSAMVRELLEHSGDPHATQATRDHEGLTLSYAFVHESQHAKRAYAGQPVVHDVRAPALIPAVRYGARHPRDRDVLPFAPPTPHGLWSARVQVYVTTVRRWFDVLVVTGSP